MELLTNPEHQCWPFAKPRLNTERSVQLSQQDRGAIDAREFSQGLSQKACSVSALHRACEEARPARVKQTLRAATEQAKCTLGSEPR